MAFQPPRSCETTSEVDRHYILGTAGHIDHGKTSLVRALTGVDTDRLPEEQRRGMTIELGFADLTVGAVRFGIVDVPGHERFVRTMVAGATGIDIALIVVAADDSVMPQTVEHVEVLHLLGVSCGVVAVTKIDTVEPDMIELVEDDVRCLLEGTALEAAPLCRVSSTTGEGLEELQRALVAAAQEILASPSEPSAKAASQPFRMAVDRVFTIQGRGTVVTGSVLRGRVTEGDTLEVWPSGETCRVRGLQTHGVHSDRIAHGQRAAVNVTGVDRGSLERGSQLATPGYLQPSRMVDVRLECLRSYGRPVKSSSVVRLEMGTTEVPVRVVLLDSDALEPGAKAFAQLRSGEPLVATFGQRFIIRDQNATRTIGGGVILRPVGRRRRHSPADELRCLRALHQGDAADRVEEVLRQAAFTTPTALQVCARAGVALDEVPEILAALEVDGRRVAVGGAGVHVVPAALDDLGRRLEVWLRRHHKLHPDLPGRPTDSVLGWLERMTGRALTRPLFDRFVEEKKLRLVGTFTCLPAFAPSLSASDEKLLAAMIEEFRVAGFQPPSLDGLAKAARPDRKRRERLATLATATGQLVQVEAGMLLHAEVENRLRDTVAELIRRGGNQGVTVGQVREALGSTRKFVVPFLEYLDRLGFTKRTGDHRVLVEKEHG